MKILSLVFMLFLSLPAQAIDSFDMGGFVEDKAREQNYSSEWYGMREICHDRVQLYLFRSSDKLGVYLGWFTSSEIESGRLKDAVRDLYGIELDGLTIHSLDIVCGLSAEHLKRLLAAENVPFIVVP